MPWKDARYEGCKTGTQIVGRIRWLRAQEAWDIEAKRQQYENFWIFKIMQKFPSMSYEEAAREFFTNETRNV